MKTITAKEARSLSIDNNLEFQERKKQFDEALEILMYEINDAAKMGLFKVKGLCHYNLLESITNKLNEFGYEVSLDGYSMSSLLHREQGVITNMVTFKVIWE